MRRARRRRLTPPVAEHDEPGVMPRLDEPRDALAAVGEHRPRDAELDETDAGGHQPGLLLQPLRLARPLRQGWRAFER